MSDLAVPAPIPAPDVESRDDIGRLVSVTWNGPGSVPEPADKRWLVAVDGSDCSLRAVVAAARMVGAEAQVDLLHVQPWLVKEAAQTELARRGWEATVQARQILDAAAVRWRLHVVMGEAAPQITAMAEALRAFGIAIGSQGLSAAASLILGSVAYKVVYTTKLPLLIAP